MRKVLTFALGLLIAGSLLAQHPAYEHFKEVRNAQDTTAMKSLLDAWEQEEPERYAAWAGYCSVQGGLTENPEWYTRGLAWAENGLEAFPDNVLLLYKKAESLIENERGEDALATFLRLCELEEDPEDAWFYMTQLYAAKRDLDSARVYAEKLSRSEDEDFQQFGTEVVANVDGWYRMYEERRTTPDFQALRSFARTAEFQDLLQRFEACYTTLTGLDVSNLYYANGFRSNPDASSATVSSTLRSLLGEQKFQESFDLLIKTLESEPLGLDFMLSAILLCEPLEIDEETRFRLAWKLNALIEAISASGTGFTEEDPVHVNGVQDEYTFLQCAYGMQQLSQQSLTDSQKDRMVFLNGDGMTQTVYFALSPAYWERLEGMFTDDE